MKKETQHMVPKVTHIMADGTELDTLVGYKLDLDKVPPIVFRLVGDMIRKGEARERAEEEAKRQKEEELTK